MKKIFTLAVIAFGSVALVACGGGQKSTSEAALEAAFESAFEAVETPALEIPSVEGVLDSAIQEAQSEVNAAI